MRSEILLAGLGWIVAGVISIEGWKIELGRLGASAAPSNLLYTGILVLAIGAALLLMNKRITALEESMLAERKRRERRRR